MRDRELNPPINTDIPCEDCNGDGIIYIDDADEYVTCSLCHGDGIEAPQEPDEDAMYEERADK